MSKRPETKFAKALWTLKSDGPAAVLRKGGRYIKSRRAASGDKSPTYDYVANPLFHITEGDIVASRRVNQSKPKTIKTGLWFVPYFNHIAFGGIYTIFRFMEYVAKQGVAVTIVIYDNQYLDQSATKKEIADNFPALKNAKLIVFDPSKDKITDLPASDISFATIWMSAYLLLRYNQTKHKYYFIQDYEPLFYEGGSVYALAESTYRFGFSGVVNTPGLLAATHDRHGMQGISFVPAVDKRYYPPDTPRNNQRTKIFFYARPLNPRNAFDLGVVIIKQLLAKYGDRIEIITAGAKWDEGVYGLAGQVTNLGLLPSIDEVADLYRQCDIGFVYMLSKHPSYQPFEFMACGMATVSNRNEDNLWFFKDGENCLLAEPSPTDMAEKIGQLIDDPKLRQKIATNGQRGINYDWESQLEKVWSDIKDSK